MRFLCDVHITIQLSKRLEQLGHQSEHVNNILDNWHTEDSDIIKYIDDRKGILITKDQDFRNNFLLNRTPKKLIKINLGNISNKELIHLIETYIDQISELHNRYETFMIEINKNNYWTLTK